MPDSSIGSLRLSYRRIDTAIPSSEQAGVMAMIGFGRNHQRGPDPRHLTIGLPPVNASDLVEMWEVPSLVDRGWQNDLGFVASPDLIFVHVLAQEGDGTHLTQVADALYSELLVFLKQRGFPHLLRVWNQIESIHEQAGDQERYQAFNAGRARALDRMGLKTGHLPAASAIGTHCPGLLVYALAARRPGMPIENPRQVPAYRYPECYGPHPPYFARAMQLGWTQPPLLFLSGTASVVGHRSLHVGDPQAQLTETLLNLERLLDAAGTSQRPQWLRVYLRETRQIQWVEPRLRAWAGPQAAILALHGEICRRDLALEIEGLVQP